MLPVRTSSRILTNRRRKDECMVDKELTPDRARKGHELFRFRHATRERLLHKNVLTGVERLFRQCKVRTNRRRDGDEVDLGIDEP